MSSFDRPSRRLLLAATVLTILGLGQAARAQDDEEEEPAPMQPAGVVMVFNNAQFDQWVFGNGGSTNAGAARNKLDSLLKLSVEDLERTCGLSPIQKKKLMLAGHGDIKRYFDRVEELRKKFDQVKNNQNAFGLMWQEIQGLQSVSQSGLLGDDSIFAKALKSTLSPEQVSKHEEVVRDRLLYRYRARVDLAIELLNNSVGFTDEQRQRLVELMAKETRPPRRLGQNDYWAILYILSTLPEAKLKPIFEDVQYSSLKRQLDQARGLGAWLKQNGFIPDQGAERGQATAKAVGGGEMIAIPAIRIAPAVRVRQGELP